MTPESAPSAREGFWRFGARRLDLALLVVGLLWAFCWALRYGAPPPPPAQAEGSFRPGGEYPGKAIGLKPAPRTWGSWSGSDDNEGQLRIGPFSARSRFRLALSGYPKHSGNQLYLEIPDTGFRWPLDAADVGESWQIQEFAVPGGMQGWQVNLIAIDHARGVGGWFGVSEPLPLADGWPIAIGLGATLAAWIANGLLFALLFFPAARWFGRQSWLPAAWVGLAAGAAVAVVGYAAFWAYFWNPLVGRTFSIAVFLLVLRHWLTREKIPDRDGAGAVPEWLVMARLAACIGLAYVGALHLAQSSRSFYSLAENRFIEALPGDNNLPATVAAHFWRGEPAKEIGAGWHASDRPPLQSGWQLLVWPFTSALGIDEDVASGTAGVWFELLWVPGMYGLLRALGLTRRQTAWSVAALALNAFFVLHTMYTWPKIATGALVCGAVALWLAPAPPGAAGRRILLGALFVALGWLGHGGAAFSLLAIFPFVALRALRGNFRWWVAGAGIFVLFALPWNMFQRFYDPPGTRLLKMHLAGHDQIDAVPVLQAIREAYHQQTWAQIRWAKSDNFEIQIKGDWLQLLDPSSATAPKRRSEEFFYPKRALTWWFLLGMPALVAILVNARRRATASLPWSLHWQLALWLALTILIWCSLMFRGAVIHQGTFALLLGLFALLAVWIARAGRWWLLVVAGLQTFTLATTWLRQNDTVHGPVNFLAFGLMLAAILATVALCRRETEG